jgi:hypothetical protein
MTPPTLTPQEKDYLFDLQGYRIIEDALTPLQLKQINDWVDTQPQVPTGTWLGDVEVHSYQGHDGVNYQNIIEGGKVFEELIDNPAWISEVRRYIENSSHRLSINEAFLNVRGQGGYIGIHAGGHMATFVQNFRHVTGQWMVGQINVLMALNDIGPGDGATVVIPGSHKSHEIHPVLAAGKHEGYRDDVPASEAMGAKEVHLKAGQAIMFTDAITHGSCPRVNPGNRRIMVYRYSPNYLATRFNYIPSERLLASLTPAQRAIIQSVPPRMNPNRVLSAAKESKGFIGG